jgi:hypothetical protein
MRLIATQVAAGVTFIAGLALIVIGFVVEITPLIVSGLCLFLVGSVLTIKCSFDREA